MVLSTPTGMAKNGEQDPRLIVQPDDGAEPVLELIAGARHSLRTVQFTLDDPRFVHAIIDAHRRRVAVHVLLNPQKSSGERGNDDTFAQLSHAGVAVEWTHPRFPVTHEKALVVDDERALIATFNLSPKYFGETRDHALLTEDPAQVRAIAEAFEADWHRKPYRPREDTGLIWSDNARRLIATSSTRPGTPWTSSTRSSSTPPSSIAWPRPRRAACGPHPVRWQARPQPVGHARHVRVAPHPRALRRQVHRQKREGAREAPARRRQAGARGSMNLDRSAFDLRRELGVRLDDPPVVERLGGLFDHDWHKAERWTAPDPLATDTHDVGELPDDPHFVHE